MKNRLTAGVLLALLLLASLAAGVSATSESKGKTQRVVGDVDGSGQLDALDYFMVKAHVLGTYTKATAEQKLAMDVDGDGDVNAFDYLKIKHAVLTGTPIPDPKEPEECAAEIYLVTEKKINHDEYVDCSIRIVDPSGKFGEILDEKGLVKIRGNSTSSGKKKPYNIKFSSKQDVLGMGAAKKWCLLANMFDKSLMRNKLAYDFADDLGLAYTQSSTYAAVYLNGKCLGCYQICESVAAGDTRVDIDTEGNEFLLEYEPWEEYSNPQWIRSPVCGILLGFNDPEEPTDAQKQWLKHFLTDAENALKSGNKAEIEKYWDIDSFVNDYLVHEYFKCVDAQTSSTRYYVKGGKIYGGPVWDFDLSSGNADPSYYTSYYVGNDSTQGWWCRHLWYEYFFRTDWFEGMLKKRFMEIQPIVENLYQDNELGENRIDYLQDCFGDCFELNFGKAGWKPGSKDSPYERVPFSTYEENVEFLRKWLSDRNEWMKKQWKD